MAYVIAHRNAWELRQSHSTDSGPRSRTLASFRSLDRTTVEHAQARSKPTLSADELVRLARRAGAPVELDPASQAAVTLLRELADGKPPAGRLRRLLARSFDPGPELSDAERSAAEWMRRDDAERGAALRDLLLLGDSLPAPRRSEASSFPPLVTTGR